MASRLSGDGAAGRWVLGCPNAMCDGGRRERAVRGAVGCRAGMARGCSRQYVSRVCSIALSSIYRMERLYVWYFFLSLLL